jgi:hypothetical protein
MKSGILLEGNVRITLQYVLHDVSAFVDRKTMSAESVSTKKLNCAIPADSTERLAHTFGSKLGSVFECIGT